MHHSEKYMAPIKLSSRSKTFVTSRGFEYTALLRNLEHYINPSFYMTITVLLHSYATISWRDIEVERQEKEEKYTAGTRTTITSLNT
jgi:hypothetical protein